MIEILTDLKYNASIIGIGSKNYQINFEGIFTLYSLHESYLSLRGAWTKLICSLINNIRLGEVQ